MRLCMKTRFGFDQFHVMIIYPASFFYRVMNAQLLECLEFHSIACSLNRFLCPTPKSTP